MHNLTKRSLIYFIGLAILTLGVALMIHSTLGADPWDSLTYTLFVHYGLSVGTWTFLVGIMMVLLAAAITRTLPNVFAIAAGFASGVLIDMWFVVLVNHLPSEALLLQFIYFVLGIVAVGFGTALYVMPKFPANPIDNFMVKISSHFNIPLGIAKWATDLFGFVLLLAFGGKITLGTIFILVSIGAIVGVFDKLLSRTKLIKYAR